MQNQEAKNQSGAQKNSSQLTGIERQLVLQYLMDANVPVTLTEEIELGQEKAAENEKSENGHRIRTVASGVFPVALPGEQITVLDQGIILLKNPPESVKVFDGKKVRVQFYFNRLGLYFITTVKTVKSGLALVIPSVISKIQEKETKKTENFSAVLCFNSNSSSEKNISSSVNCGFSPEYRLFVNPKCSDVEEPNQQEAKKYLEKFVMLLRSDGKSIGNGLFLISVVRFLSDKNFSQNQSIEGRKNPPQIIYIDHERLVLAAKKENIIVNKDEEYSVVLGFPISKGPIKERTVYAVFTVENIFEDDLNQKCCAVCRYKNIKEEDVRYLEDKKN